MGQGDVAGQVHVKRLLLNRLGGYACRIDSWLVYVNFCIEHWPPGCRLRVNIVSMASDATGTGRAAG
jgi:hypothetical protein